MSASLYPKLCSLGTRRAMVGWCMEEVLGTVARLIRCSGVGTSGIVIEALNFGEKVSPKNRVGVALWEKEKEWDNGVFMGREAFRLFMV